MCKEQASVCVCVCVCVYVCVCVFVCVCWVYNGMSWSCNVKLCMSVTTERQ